MKTGCKSIFAKAKKNGIHAAKRKIILTIMNAGGTLTDDIPPRWDASNGCSLSLRFAIGIPRCAGLFYSFFVYAIARYLFVSDFGTHISVFVVSKIEKDTKSIGQ